MRALAWFSLGAVSIGLLVEAQVGFNGSRVVIDFDNTLAGVNEGQFTGSGFAPSPATGQLDSDAWAVSGLSDGDVPFGGTATSGDAARGSSGGGVAIGGVYAFSAAGSSNYGLGVQPTEADLTPGTIKLRVRNDTGGTLTRLRVAYSLYVYNDENRATQWTVSYSTDDTTYHPVSGQDYTSPLTADSTPLWTAVQRDFVLVGLSVPAGGYLYVAWHLADAGGADARDEFALDDIVLTVPEPASAGWLGLAGAMGGWGLRRTHRRR